MKIINFFLEKCTNCEYCIKSCPVEIIKKTKKLNGVLYPGINEIEKCIECRMCVQICPESAIEFKKIKNSRF